MGGRGRVAAAGEVVEKRITDFDRDPRLVGPLRGLDLQNIDGAELVAQDGTAARWGLLAVKGLEATTCERCNRKRGCGPHHSMPTRHRRTPRGAGRHTARNRAY